MIKLTEELSIELQEGDVLLYSTEDVLRIKSYHDGDEVSLYNCTEILCFSSRRHFVSPAPFNWKEIRF